MNSKKILSKSKLTELTNQINPQHTLDTEVEDVKIFNF
jgi:hypothetical protein